MQKKICQYQYYRIKKICKYKINQYKLNKYRYLIIFRKNYQFYNIIN